ncbi:cobalt ABC transporter permease [Vandammella animalimorsus]|uniref:Cobalt ABC transporter permease n=1 Tax=Vandammella animalimorsus TaxID=2029117 RepID=A0A2A2AU80_9BURK|nr:DUF2523 family protein [Vandammella animalimorsus]PAT41396.1 cobalt ABC transporter permease [Vandammella animalimorsus]
MPFIPAIIAAFIGAIARALPSLIYRVMAALGLGLITYQGMNVLLNHVKQFAGSAFGALGAYPFMSELAGFFMLDKHVSIVLSAISVKLVLMGWDRVSGSVTRLGRR